MKKLLLLLVMLLPMCSIFAQDVKVNVVKSDGLKIYQASCPQTLWSEDREKGFQYGVSYVHDPKGEQSGWVVSVKVTSWTTLQVLETARVTFQLDSDDMITLKCCIADRDSEGRLAAGSKYQITAIYEITDEQVQEICAHKIKKMKMDIAGSYYSYTDKEGKMTGILQKEFNSVEGKAEMGGAFGKR